MRRRRSSFRKEKAIMLASSCLVLTALTVTGLYVRNLGEEKPEENVVDFTALEDGEEGQEYADGDEMTMLGSRAEVSEKEAAAGTSSERQAEREEADRQLSEEAATGAKEGWNDEAAGEAALTDEARQDEPQQDEAQAEDEALPNDGELAEAEEEEALAANASDAIVDAEAAEEEEADAMSASTLLDFTDSDTLVWPIVGNVLVNYSMDKTVYFATLDQYKYSPAIVIAAAEGEEITAAADGQVTDVYQDPEIGTAVVMNLGDGYELTYGQLTDLSVAEGDMVTTGEIIGKVAAPTMYYSVEGTNVYFKLTKDGVPVDPMSRLG